MSRPRLLDLFCCAGGAAEGYHRAGFDVVGVDIEPQPNYPYEFHQRDALEVLDELDYVATFDAVHASPPCQGYLNLSRQNEAMGRRLEHDQLIVKVREGLRQHGLPYIIENVENARPHMLEPIRLCGSSFGLPIRRHRLFESSEPLVGVPCNHHWQTVPRYWTGYRPKAPDGTRAERKSTVVQIYGNGGDTHEWGPALGLEGRTPRELAEAIPPAYTEFLGRQLLRFVELRDYRDEAA